LGSSAAAGGAMFRTSEINFFRLVLFLVRARNFTCDSSEMILLTHNMLISPMKGATKQLHLGIEAEEVEVKEREYNREFLIKMMERLDWPAFVAAAKTVTEYISGSRGSIVNYHICNSLKKTIFHRLRTRFERFC
jgi:hypothetical protein